LTTEKDGSGKMWQGCRGYGNPKQDVGSYKEYAGDHLPLPPDIPCSGKKHYLKQTTSQRRLGNKDLVMGIKAAVGKGK
jgi:hypothetical protein